MKRMQFGWLVGLLVGFAGVAQANPIVPANDGVGSVVNRVGNQFDITGGTRAGQNLFHSLLKFGLSQEQIANFLSQPSIRNILTRVTGGETSVINGLIKVTGGNSNLYLLNPAGLVFGPNGRLDIPGSFYGTTANAIKVGDGWFGLSTAPSELQRLTGHPGGLAFSSGNQVLNGELAGVIKNEGQLRVPGGERVVLAGGVVVNTGTIETPHGQIVVTATPGGRYVEVTPAGSVLSFRLPVADDAALAAGNLRPLRLEDVVRLATGSVEVGGSLTTASRVVNPNSRIELVGERVKLVRGVGLSTEGTEGLMYVRVSPLVPVEQWVFVERFPNFEDVVSSLAPGNQLVLLNRADSGVEKVNQALAGQAGLKGIHVVGDGNRAQIWFGRDFITPESLDSYAEQLAQWGQYLDKDGGIFFYACNLAETAAGKALVDNISKLTGRAVGASTDVTGLAKYGGNWLLEYGPGGSLPFTVEGISQADVRLLVYTVNNSADPGPALGPGTTTYSDGISDDFSGSLRAVITDPNGVNNQTPPHRVRFNFNTPTTIQLTAGQILISKDVLFDVAPGKPQVTIKATPNSRVFEIDANVIFDGSSSGGIVIQGNGTVAGNGGVIKVNSGKSLTIGQGVRVTGGNATIKGGGIYADNANVTLVGNAQVDGNTAGKGGGIYIDTASGAATLKLQDNAKVIGNTAGKGGGIYIDTVNGAATLTLQNSALVSGNTATNQGGGIYIDGSVNPATLTLQNSALVSGNTATNQGGGIYFTGVGATLNLKGSSQISGNQVTAAVGKGGGLFIGANSTVNFAPGNQVKILGNQASGNASQGGGIYTDSNLIVTADAQITGNSADKGGGIFVAAGKNLQLQDNVQVKQNIAINEGGGIYFTGGVGTTLTLQDNAQISGNQVTAAGGKGGGLFIDANSIVNFVAANQVKILGNQASGNASQGGGIYTNSNLIVTADAQITGNSAGKGGGIFVAAGKNLQLQDNVQVKQNIAINEGGGIYFTGGGTTLSLKDQVLIEGNQVQADAGRGAGIFVGANGALQFPPPATPGDANKVKITDNQAVGNNSQGGGIFSEDNWQILPGLVNPVNVEIRGNRAARGGGFVVAAGKIVTLGGDVKVQDNQSTGVGGGGIYVDTSGTLILKGNVQVTGNKALNVGKGGGLFAAPLSNVTLKDNTKLQGNQAGKFGGAIFADLGSQLLLQDNVLLGGTPGEANVAFKGGGIYANQVNQLVLQDNVKVIGNRTPNAGGAGIYAADTNNFILQGNVQIKANEAGFFGAGIRLQNSTANLQGNVQVIDNIADVSTGRGGGIYAGEGSNLNIANNVQIQNNTAFKGGGIYVDGSTLAMTDNALVSGNQTPNAGGAGIFAFNGTVNLAGAVQINNNTAAFFGGGVRLDGSSTLISQGNVKFLSNTAQFGGGIYVGDTSSASLLGVTEVRNNTATNDGGGIFKPGTLIIGPAATVTSNTPNDVSP